MEHVSLAPSEEARTKLRAEAIAKFASAIADKVALSRISFFQASETIFGDERIDKEVKATAQRDALKILSVYFEKLGVTYAESASRAPKNLPIEKHNSPETKAFGYLASNRPKIPTVSPQLKIMWIGIGLFVIALIVPPWKFTLPKNAGRNVEVSGPYALLFSPPEVPLTQMEPEYRVEYFRNAPRNLWSVHIDVPRLSLSIGIIAAIMTGLVLTLREKMKKAFNRVKSLSEN